MPIEITMPALSPTMEEGTLASWLVAEGDQVNAGDLIAEIETDKATMEFAAPEGGTVAKLLVAEGSENIAVDTLIALFAADGEDPAGVATVATPSASKSDEEQIEKPPVTLVKDSPERVEDTSDETRVKASPLAKRIAADQGVEITGLAGSGPKGRIVRVDVEAAINNAKAIPVATATQSNSVDVGPYAEGKFDVVELDTMRRTIARRLTESKQTVPHFYLRADVELDALLALRKQLNDNAPMDGDTPAFKISVNDLIIKALALALAEVPDANVTWADGKMLRHHSVDVAVAVAIDGGLITPIVREAEKKSISAISSEMKDLAERARSKKLQPEEYQGGTTSVSNLGMFGVSSFDAVINPPQGTILAVGAGQKRPVVRGEELAVATVMTTTLSVDHRLVDGALGADLLAVFKRYVEAPLTILS